MTKRAFVTGATGFVGGALVRRLVSDGWELVVLVREQSQYAPLENLGATVVFGDLCQPESLTDVLKGCSVVFHCAALTGVEHRIDDFHQVIAGGTNNLLQAADSAGVQRFVYVSSILVYELTENATRYTESMPLLTSSVDPYGRAKIAAESACLEARQAGLFQVSILRPVFVYGPGDRPGGFLPTLLSMLRTGRFRLVDGGRSRIPMIYISDLVELLILAAEQPQADGQIYNACSAASPQWHELTTTLCEEMQLAMPGNVNGRLVGLLASAAEGLAKIGLLGKLPISKAAVKLLSHDVRFPTDKAEQQLGYQSRVAYRQGIIDCMPMLRESLNSSAGSE
ncbi:NAD-dependent epimerase/dehydratase family protein [Porticoccus sp.]|uniref:NAD-dependent epimerase/dehydratase family protein n=1 Tax=Porticoccus sp. TaxID=2024853 RepID=UPI0039E37CAC